LLKDFWNMPEYNEMLNVMQENLNAAVVGNITPKKALDTIDERQHEILEKAGYGGVDIAKTPLGTHIVVYAMRMRRKKTEKPPKKDRSRGGAQWLALQTH
jgi:hypothetical protein